MCGFVCWENGAHEPTPSVLYFCQPRVADERRLPWVKSWRGTYAIGIVLFKINLHAGDHSFVACGNGGGSARCISAPDVLCVWEGIKKQCVGKSTTPKGVASSLALLPRVGCVALANPALSKV